MNKQLKGRELLTSLTDQKSLGQTSSSDSSRSDSNPDDTVQAQAGTSKKTQSVADADAQLRERLEKMSGEGGAAGIEYEDGKPSAMKRGVRNNMFRLI
ncbi:hypothetical protein N7539_003668 [Penicillium diatomitis]|uniref:Uncharacterized protein n=1 Tax=Penicillium diatomitis TaxID=2819901 RepID=A0A9W9XD08_9EURO|nr:uncharacterized protein N7539_003668 [Penicillium diatomitis]KAJ5488778.1 hypothetical protein N7539_003668 [Penicillium diatomitis]